MVKQGSPPLFETRSHQVVRVPEAKTLPSLSFCGHVHHHLIVIIGIAINCYQLQPGVAACQAWPLLPQDDRSRSSNLASHPPAVVCGGWNILVILTDLFLFDYKKVPLPSSTCIKCLVILVQIYLVACSARPPRANPASPESPKVELVTHRELSALQKDLPASGKKALSMSTIMLS